MSELCVYACGRCKHALNEHDCPDCDEYMLSHREGSSRGHHGGCEVKDCPCTDLEETALVGIEAAVFLTDYENRQAAIDKK